MSAYRNGHTVAIMLMHGKTNWSRTSCRRRGGYPAGDATSTGQPASSRPAPARPSLPRWLDWRRVAVSGCSSPTWPDPSSMPGWQNCRHRENFDICPYAVVRVPIAPTNEATSDACSNHRRGVGESGPPVWPSGRARRRLTPMGRSSGVPDSRRPTIHRGHRTSSTGTCRSATPTTTTGTCTPTRRRTTGKGSNLFPTPIPPPPGTCRGRCSAPSRRVDHHPADL